MSSETLQFMGYAPIPAGHAVELTYFGRTPSHLFGKSEPEKDARQPMVRDLDTGIVYQTPWIAEGRELGKGGRFDFPIGPAPELPVMERRVVRVLACRVLSSPGDSFNALVTTLVVEPLPPGEGPQR